MNTPFHHVFVEILQDLFDAEGQMVKALPEVIKAVDDADLKKALEDHLKETKHQVERLKRVFRLLKEEPEGTHCKAMEGLIKEMSEVLKKHAKSPVKDAFIIVMAQKIEHYEIAGYGGARTFANEMGHDEAAELLQESLDEEAAADKNLTKLAEGGIFSSGINKQAQEAKL